MRKKVITNAMVKQALDDCIQKRWIPIHKNKGVLLYEKIPSCQLCDLFVATTVHDATDCLACPLHLYETQVLGRNGHCSSASGSAYGDWLYANDKKEAAHRMVMTLIATRAHFFS